ncbi:GNAT family N-acetyltransferase [Oceanirhabdus sp. W0125-5]|uniref:GNAT family N-acetyltransferase n=1 Tax=Oceanirhabdus sp. W0125-5 TaxID=2999116 RepID=UPI0022F33456|nr:GNAT family N-acetyltransferase [Oceanirhabdus sp. W0125-5]WBW96677.1 GNAT family N-acetyltransferase [Oceanirhabdus sp. W0125-5]
MVNNFKISNMEFSDVNEAKEIWHNQYKRYCDNSSFPSFWKNDKESVERFLNWKIKNNNAIVAKLDNKVVGFLAYDVFPFHGENSAFCPAIGHAVVEEYKERVYLELYKSISHEWVKKNIFNHLWTIFFNDVKLKNVLFELGYGSYLIDAFNDSNISSSEKSICEIRKATIENIDVLYELVEESNEYYESAPLFLKRDKYSKEEIKAFIVKNNVFIAWDKELPIGFINLSINEDNDVINMAVKNCGLIDEIGAYIKLEYRNKKVGIHLLKRVNDYCRENNIPYIHVDFETANLYGNKFWKKYFDPMLLSMRRPINRDINKA